MSIAKIVQQILSRQSVTKFFLILFLSISIIQTSCNKSSEVGLNVQPSTDLLNVNFIDTTVLITRTVKEDSIRTDHYQLQAGYGLLGKYIDPVFGTTQSSIYTQIRLPSSITSTSFGTSPVCDSVVLSLIYDSQCYGKKVRKAQTVNVYELLNGITSGTYYYSNNSFLNTGVDLAGGYSFIPKPTDSITIDGVKSKAQLRIPLNTAFGQNILNHQASGNLIDNTSFQNFIKGFFITTENTSGLTVGHGNIMRFLMASSSITIYYHNPKNMGEKYSFSKYEFSLANVSRNMHFSHDYSTITNPDLSSQLSSNPPSQNNTVYIQAMAGLKTKVEMPALMDWAKNGSVSINKAELVLKVKTTNPTYQRDDFAAPSSLIVFGINDDGTSYLLPDYIQRPFYYDYSYDAANKEYHLVITRYIQQILDGEKNNNGIYITIPHIAAATSANRVIIGGGTSGSPNQMKLKISYTKLH